MNFNLLNNMFSFALTTTGDAGEAPETAASATDFVTKISAFFQQFSGVVNAVAIIALIVIGMCFVIPSEKTKEFAKSHLGWVIIGVAIVLCATSIANGLASSF